MPVKELVLVGIIIGIIACGKDGLDGAAGIPGVQGTTGAACTVEQIPDGALIRCGGTYAIVEHGKSCEGKHGKSHKGS